MKRAAAMAGTLGLAMAAGATRFPPAPEHLSLFRGQDPSIVYRNGQFHLVQSENSRSGAALYIYSSPTMEGFAGRGSDAPEKVCVWRAPTRGPLSRNVWAPELEFINNRWYIYFAADDGRNENHRMYVLESTTPDPRGPYAFRGKVTDSTDRWAIDGIVLQVPRGTTKDLYFIWSGWEGPRNGMQHLYIARMTNPWTISSERVRISSPDQPWERRSGATPCFVNEGPAALVRGNKVVLAYSANGFWSDDYCVGLLTCDIDRLMDPTAWHKGPGPVFAKSDGLFSVGHNCFVQGPARADAPGVEASEKEWWFVYHGVREPGMNGENREIFAQRFGWNEQGLPQLGRPPVELAQR